MYNMPAVCIMIPTYNQAGFIALAVESALAQDYPNLEILVSDDYSSDNTKEVLQPYIDRKQIIYKKNKVNLGRVANYRCCLYNYTTADWVINLDGDDFYTNAAFISDAITSIKNIGEEKVLFYQGVHIFKTKNDEIIQMPRISGEQALLNGEKYFYNFFRLEYFSHMSTLYNRKLAIQSGFYEKDVISADVFSFIKYAINNKDKIIIINKSISGAWVQHIINASSTISISKHIQNFTVYKTLYRHAIKNGFNKLSCYKWLITACYTYLRIYAGSFIRKIMR